MSLPGIGVASLFILVFSLGFLITPALLGGGRTLMVAEYISVQISNTGRWDLATSLSTVLLIVVGLLLALALRSPTMRAAFGRRLEMSARMRNRLLMAIVWLMLLFLFLPVLVVIPVSITDKSYLSLPVDGTSFEHYASLADPARGWIPSFRNSIIAAIATSIIATAIAAAFAVGAWIRSGWWPSSVRLLMLSPLIVPPIIYAVGVVRVLSKMSMLDTFWGVLVVHVVLSLPMAFLAIAASLSNLDNRMVTAARSLGARPMTIFGRVILPNIAPGARRRRVPRVHHLVGRDHCDAVHHGPALRDAAAPHLHLDYRFHRSGARRYRGRPPARHDDGPDHPEPARRTRQGGGIVEISNPPHHSKREFR